MTPNGAEGRTTALALRLARRELRGGLRGFRIFLACLTLGVAAIAAVGSVSEAMLTGLASNGRTLLGGDLDVRLVHREATPEQRAWMEARAQVSEVAEMRTMLRAPEPDDSRMLVELRAVDGLYPLYGNVVLDPPGPLADALAYRDGAWGAAVDGNVLSRLDLEIGARVGVGTTTVEIRAVIEREPDRTARALTFGPHVLISSDGLADTGLVQPGSMIQHHYRLRVPDGANPAGLHRALDQAFPDAGWRIRGTSAAAPGVSRFIERLGLFLTLVGLTALLVGGLGVGNAVKSYLDGRVATIATLKCLGTSGRLIFRTYLVQILILALIGVVVGLALGAAAPYALDALLGNRLGWKAAGGIYPLPLAIAATFGVLTAVVFSLWPLAHARAVPAATLFRETVAPSSGPLGRPERRTLVTIGLTGLALIALTLATVSDREFGIAFVLGAIAALGLFRLAALGVVDLARRWPRPRNAELRLAIANLHRPGAPTGSVVMSLGLGLSVLVAIALVEVNLTRQVTEELPEDAPGFYFIDIQPDQVDEFDRLVRATPGVHELKRVPMLRGRITAINGVPPSQMEIPPEIGWVFRGDRGLTWTARPSEDVELTAGEWWPEDYQGPPLVSLDNEVGQLLGLQPGDRIGINVLGRNVSVEIANLRVIEWSGLQMNFVMVFSPGLLEAAPQSHIATVRADPDTEDALERAVTDRFANVSAIRVKEALSAVADLLGQIATTVRVTAGVALVAGVLVLAGALAAGHRRRVYDAVVLKVLGATRPAIARAFLVEYGLLGFVTAAIAAVVGTVAAYGVLTYAMGLDFEFNATAALGTAGLAAAITLAFGFVGTWRALGHKAAPLLRNQ